MQQRPGDIDAPPLTAQGALTGLAGGASPAGGLVLNLQRMIACVRIGGEGTTAEIMEEFSKVRTVDEFVLFVSRKARSLGRLHNTAYRHFRRLLAILTGPESSPNGVEEETYTVRDVVRMYLRMPGQAARGGE